RRYCGANLPGAGRNDADAGVPVIAGRNSAAGGLLGQILHLPQPDRNRALRAGVAGRAVCGFWTVLLHAHWQCHAYAAGAGQGAAEDWPFDGCGSRGHGFGNAVHRHLSRAVHSGGRLVVGVITASGHSAPGEVVVGPWSLAVGRRQSPTTNDQWPTTTIPRILLKRRLFLCNWHATASWHSFCLRPPSRDG